MEENTLTFDFLAMVPSTNGVRRCSSRPARMGVTTCLESGLLGLYGVRIGGFREGFVAEEWIARHFSQGRRGVCGWVGFRVGEMARV